MSEGEHRQRENEEVHSALWLDSTRGSLRVGSAPVPTPGPGDVIVRARAVAVNPIDGLGGVARRVVLPWLHYPAVLGSDVAGEVVAIGSSVQGMTIGDRVVGYAVGVEKNRNNPAEGAFQSHVALMARMCSVLPDAISFEAAAVLPLALTTAAAGLFEKDQLDLVLPTAKPTEPTAKPTEQGQTVVIFGGATSVGMNAIQLARNAGYDVIATASTRNFEFLQSLGDGALVDYHDSDVIEKINRHLDGRHLAGILALANGSLSQAIAVAISTVGPATKRIASAHPTPVTRIRGALARRHGVHVSAIWGGTPKDTPVGPAIWNAFLPSALAEQRYKPAPTALVIGHGLAVIPDALARIRTGVSAQKIVVTL